MTCGITWLWVEHLGDPGTLGWSMRPAIVRKGTATTGLADSTPGMAWKVDNRQAAVFDRELHMPGS